VIEQLFGDLPVGLAAAGFGAAGHLHRNLDGQGSTGEQHLGVLAVQRAAYRYGNTGWLVPRRGSGHAGKPAAANSAACPLRQASRIVTADSGTDNQLAAASSVTENRRETLIGGALFGRTGPSTQAGRQLLSPAQAASRSSTSVAQPD
jgi:hypothetical protein